MFEHVLQRSAQLRTFQSLPDHFFQFQPARFSQGMSHCAAQLNVSANPIRSVSEEAEPQEAWRSGKVREWVRVKQEAPGKGVFGAKHCDGTSSHFT